MTIQLLHKKLIKKKLTISVAESCTGGAQGHKMEKYLYLEERLCSYSHSL